MMLTLHRPSPEECSSYYYGYVAKVSGENIGEQLRQQLHQVELGFGAFDDETALLRYSPGKWSVKEILGHMADTERIFAYRLLRIARGDVTPLPGFDQNAYVPTGSFDARALRSLMEEFRAVRLSSIATLEGLPPEAWARRGEASGNAVSTRALAYIMVGHVAHHLAVLQERYRRGATTAAR